jgi:hypothetical protein
MKYLPNLDIKNSPDLEIYARLYKPIWGYINSDLGSMAKNTLVLDDIEIVEPSSHFCNRTLNRWKKIFAFEIESFNFK